MPAKSEKSAASGSAPFLKGLAEMPQLNARMLTRANEILSEAAKAIWAGEIELARLEAEEGSKLLFLSKPAGDPGKLTAEAFTQWHQGSEKILTQMRAMGDIMRKCGWDLCELYAEGVQRPGKNSESE